MVKQCTSCCQALPSFDDYQTCAHCRYASGTCQLDASSPCQACQGYSLNTWGKLRKSLQDARAKFAISYGQICHLGNRTDPTINTMVPAPQCATVLMCAPLPLQGPTVSARLLVQSTSVSAPMLVLGTFLPPGTRTPITMQGPALPPMASAQMFFPAVTAAPAPMQSAAAERRYAVNGRCAVAQSRLPIP